jgi:hypothetical protein
MRWRPYTRRTFVFEDRVERLVIQTTRWFCLPHGRVHSLTYRDWWKPGTRMQPPPKAMYWWCVESKFWQDRIRTGYIPPDESGTSLRSS